MLPPLNPLHNASLPRTSSSSSQCSFNTISSCLPFFLHVNYSSMYSPCHNQYLLLDLSMHLLHHVLLNGLENHFYLTYFETHEHAYIPQSVALFCQHIILYFFYWNNFLVLLHIIVVALMSP